MAFWPFRRKRKEARSAKEPAEDDLDLGISTHISGPIDHKNRRSRSRQDSKLPTGLESKNRTWPQPPTAPPPAVPKAASQVSQVSQVSQSAPQDSPPAAKAKSAREARQPLAELQAESIAPPQPPFTQSRHQASLNSLQAENFTATPVPTLQPKRRQTSPEVSRAKSSKRKAEEKQREQELRAKSPPPPIPPRSPRRPKSLNYNTPLAQDNQPFRHGLNRYLQRNESQVSLPIADSLRSSVSGAPEMSSSFRVSSFAALSPRPTIRHSGSLNRVGDMPSRASTRKDKNPAIPEEPFSPRARIDELAEDMDATTIRKLMERDGRRRERKKISDTDKLEKRLQRRLEKEKARQSADADDDDGDDGKKEKKKKIDDAEAAEAVKQPAQEQEHDPASPQEESSQHAERRKSGPVAPQSPSSWLHERSSSSDKPEDEQTTTSPPEAESDMDKEEPVLETAQTAIRMQPPAFERPQRMALPPLVIERSFKPKGEPKVPQRTKSKFKEDLPDFRDSPVSPLSPYIDNPSKVGTMTDEEVVVTPLEDVHPLFRDSVVARAP